MLLLDSVPELREQNSKTKLLSTLNSDRHPERPSPSVDVLDSFIDSSLVHLPFNTDITAHIHTDLLLHASVTVF